MDLVELIVFIISLAAFIILSVRNARQIRRQREEPFFEENDDDETEDEEIRELLKSPRIEKEHKEYRAPIPINAPKMLEKPPTQVKGKNDGFHSPLERRHQQSTIEHRTLKTSLEDRYYDDRSLNQEFRWEKKEDNSYEVNKRERRSLVSKMILALPSKKQMVIYKEIFDKPKAMQNPRDDWT